MEKVSFKGIRTTMNRLQQWPKSTELNGLVPLLCHHQCTNLVSWSLPNEVSPPLTPLKERPPNDVYINLLFEVEPFGEENFVSCRKPPSLKFQELHDHPRRNNVCHSICSQPVATTKLWLPKWWHFTGCTIWHDICKCTASLDGSLMATLT